MNKLTKKFASVGLTVTTAVWLSGATMFVPVASAQSTAELQALINSLLVQIAALQAQLNAAQGVAPSTSFTRDLTVGSTGDDVKALQQWLNAGGYQVAASGAGSPGNESSYFGSLTRAALAKYQAAKGITPSVGYFGPKTRASIAAAAPVTPTVPGVTPVVGAALRVEGAGPAAAIIPDGSIYNNLLKLKFTAGSSDASVTGVIITRGGFVANTNVTGISAWDDAGARYGNIITALTSDGQATLSFGNKPFMVPAGTTKYLTLAANISAAANGGSISFNVNSASNINVSGGVAVEGTFPVSGNVMTIVDGASSLGNLYADDVSIAGLTYSGIESSSVTGNVEIGDTQREVFKLRLTQNNSLEAVKVERIVVYAEGTLQESTDLKNWTLYSPEGSVLATAAQSYDRYVTFALATPYVIDKGLAKDFSVKVDIADGSSRYFRVFIQNDYDILVRGVTTGAGVLALDSAGGALTASDTQLAAGGFKMKQGTLTVSRNSASPSGAIAPSAQNVVFGKFDLKSAGEKLEVQKMYIAIVKPASGVVLTGSLTVRDAVTGETYLSISADTSGLQKNTGTATTTADMTSQNLSAYMTIESGATKTIEVVGTVAATATSSSNYTANVGGFYVRRFSTNDYTTTPATTAAPTTGNQIDVRDVSLTVTKSTSFPDSNRSPGALDAKIAEFTFQASAADDIRINSVNFTMLNATSVQNLTLKDGTTPLGSTIGTPSDSSNVFSPSGYTILKSQTKTLALYANVLTSAAGTFRVNVAASGVSGYGVASGKTLSDTPSSAVTGQTNTAAAASLTIDAAPDTQISKVYLAGNTGVELGKIRFEARNDSLTLNEIVLQLKSASTTIWTVATSVQSIFARVYLYDGSTLLNTGGTTFSSGDATITGLNVSLPQGAYKTLTVKADLNGPDGMSTSTRPIVGAIQVKSTGSTDLKVQKGSGGTLASGDITLTSNAASNFFLFHGTAPSIATSDPSSKTGSPGSTEEVFRFTVSNSGPVSLTLATSTITVTLVNASTSGSILAWKLQDTSANEISTVTKTLAGDPSGNATSTTVDFAMGTVYSEINAGSSRTYVVKANTLSARGGLASTASPVRVTVKIDGAKGYLSTDESGNEYYWRNGTLSYSYKVRSNTDTSQYNFASDSGEVFGSTISYP